jgi:hypothetical protein
MPWDVRQPLPGALLIGVLHVPFVWEVALQLQLAARLYSRLSPAVRAGFPDAPATPARLFLGSARFQRAFWRYVAANGDDALEVRQLKLALRRSMRRKLIVATLGFAVAVGLVIAGWRPYPT